MSSKVTYFDTNQKPSYDFIIKVITSYIALFPGYLGLFVKFLVSTGIACFNALIRRQLPNFRIAKFSLTKLETLFDGKAQSIFRYLDPFGRDSRV